LLERDIEFAELGLAAREALAGAGSIVLVDGEAGIGKSSLVDAVRSVLPPEGRLLLGWCDDLATPRVLGPLRDLREHVGKSVGEALDAGDRARVADALRAELDWAGHPTVLVIEDVHWADEATLDVLRLLVRRVESLPAVLVLTYRDDLAPDHPLRHLLGVVARVSRVRRLHLSRLSLDAVRRLGSASGLDAEQIYALTSGNPFLVAEVLASKDLGRVPPSIAEAVGARLSTLDPPGRRAVERLSVIPSTVERWLVESVVPGGLAALASAEQHGVLSVSPTRVSFRHELTRRAVVDSLPGAVRVAGNQAVLAALLARHEEQAVDLSRIVHHAAEVGDDATIIRFGPLAAREAVAAGSHRAAVAHGRLVLRHRSAFAPAELVEILARHAVECHTTSLSDEALATQQETVALRRELGGVRELGLALRWLTRIAWWAGDRALAEECASEAIEVLTGAGDDRALAFALSNRSQLLALAGRWDEATTVGERAVTMARVVDDPAVLSHALNNVGFARCSAGRLDGFAQMEESLRVALDVGDVEHASRAYVNLGQQLLGELRLDEAAAVLDAGIELAEDAEFVAFLRYLRVVRAMVDLARAAWNDAERNAEWGIDDPGMTRCPALAVIGRVQARRGDAGADELLAEAFSIAERLGEAQRLGPAMAAWLEAAWLAGDAGAVAARVLPWYDEILHRAQSVVAADVGYWLRAAGQNVAVVEVDHPYALLARGQWREAAAAWERAGCPYERALALSHSPEPPDVLEALSILDGLGAMPLARSVRERLRDLGVSRIPRGPASLTRNNPAGLTHRQVEVLRLLADGLTNNEIASRLVVSVRTVDTHVAAILGKLAAPTRRDAARRATDLGLLPVARP
jgi:DNA-binding CsgD family transcriptional regulator/tetratricopeptide (TPR) repeat protein